MPDHKFEPFDRVLVRDSFGATWDADLFSRIRDEEEFVCVGGIYESCIPYTDETAHLLGTTAPPYESPKPPHEYKWGDRVEVMQNGEWVEGFCVGGFHSSVFEGVGGVVVLKGKTAAASYPPDRIRPLEPANE